MLAFFAFHIELSRVAGNRVLFQFEAGSNEVVLFAQLIKFEVEKEAAQGLVVPSILRLTRLELRQNVRLLNKEGGSGLEGFIIKFELLVHFVHYESEIGLGLVNIPILSKLAFRLEVDVTERDWVLAVRVLDLDVDVFLRSFQLEVND